MENSAFHFGSQMQPEELKALRKAAGLSQGELAKLAGMSLDTISRMERGMPGYPIEQRTALAISEKLRMQQIMNKMVKQRDDFIAQAEALEADPCLIGAGGQNVSSNFARQYRDHADRMQDAIDIGAADYGLLIKSLAETRSETGEGA